ncbi:MAG: hypothetical protein FWG62_05210, partial [Proteobacteria bacterium]|nr:hypothetical protein [Pseudomonadota bacterium]
MIDIYKHFMGIDQVVNRDQIESRPKFLEKIILHNRDIQCREQNEPSHGPNHDPACQGLVDPVGHE